MKQDLNEGAVGGTPQKGNALVPAFCKREKNRLLVYADKPSDAHEENEAALIRFD